MGVVDQSALLCQGALLLTTHSVCSCFSPHTLRLQVPVIKMAVAVGGIETIVDISFSSSAGIARPAAGDPVDSAASSAPHASPAPNPSAPSPSKTQPKPAAVSLPHTGLASASLVKYYIAKLPLLKPLTLVLKQLLYDRYGCLPRCLFLHTLPNPQHASTRRGLSDTYSGGLGSFCLLMMVVSYLQSMTELRQQQQYATGKMQEQSQQPQQLQGHLHPPLPPPASPPLAPLPMQLHQGNSPTSQCSSPTASPTVRSQLMSGDKATFESVTFCPASPHPISGHMSPASPAPGSPFYPASPVSLALLSKFNLSKPPRAFDLSLLSPAPTKFTHKSLRLCVHAP